MPHSQLPTIQSPLLAAAPGVRHAFFTRQGGVSTGIYDSLNVGRGSKDEPADVIENRARTARWFGVAPEDLNTCYQIHSTIAIVADGSWGDEQQGAGGGRDQADLRRRAVGIGLVEGELHGRRLRRGPPGHQRRAIPRFGLSITGVAVRPTFGFSCRVGRRGRGCRRGGRARQRRR